jgi:hypothetical protein
VAEVVETVFGVPIALGTVANREQEMRAALAPAQAAAQQAVQAAPVKNGDETGWKQAGPTRWLWAAATATVACFVIPLRRSAQGLTALLGEAVRGSVWSDRWSAPGRLLVSRRPVCWAHRTRDSQKLVDRGGVARRYGKKGLAAAQILVHEWHLFRGGGSRQRLQFELEPLRQAMRDWLGKGAGCADAQAAALCGNWLELEPALWTLLDAEGVEPTNNHRARLVRSAVLWRQRSFGCPSAAGCRLVERILTVTQTLRLQQRPVLDDLVPALQAHRAGQPAPKPLPET